MHIRPSQINSNAQLDALYAAEKAAAKAQAARTRKKLLEFASELAGEAASGGAYVVQVESHEQPQDHSQQEADRRNRTGREKQKGPAALGDEGHSVSDWA